MKRDLSITYIQANQLKADANNPRTHSKKQTKQIAASISAFGWTNPILVDEENSVIAGHGRLLAAREIGIANVPTIRIGGLSKSKKRALALADNKLALNAGWDEELLAQELKIVIETDIEFDLDAVGFETPEIDMILEESPSATTPEDLAVPAPPSHSHIRWGDLFQLGSHRVLCGDSRHQSSCDVLLEGEAIRIGFADPPYNVAINGHVSGNGGVKHHEFAMASGEMSEDEFLLFMQDWIRQVVSQSSSGALLFVCIDWRHGDALYEVARRLRIEIINVCVWAKPNGGMGSFYRSRHEFVFVLKVSTGTHTNNIQLGRFGRNRTNVWEYPGASSVNSEARAELSHHPTVKPTQMIVDLLLDASNRNDIFLDPFLGSGSSLLAAERVGRRLRGIEIEPTFVELSLTRWQSETGNEAIHCASGLPLKTLLNHRRQSTEIHARESDEQ